MRTHDYLAHRAEDGRTQTIPAHLRGTAALARDFAQSFGAQELAYQTGLAHDAGKYSDAFQKRIRTLGPKVDHSTAGAQALGQLGLLSGAYCAAGHHGGLPDGGGRFDGANDPTLAGRLQKQVGSYDGFYRDITLSPPVFRKPQPLGRGGFTDSFWIRMLFSCLVDADFLDTEAFMQGGPPPRGRALNATALLQRLDAYVQPWWDAETPLNRARCAILRACMDAGAQKPGLFTLTVPTGGGKTVASLAFALRHAAAYGKKRIVYVIPFTSIIEQTADTFRDILGGENVLEHHANVDFDNEADPEIGRKKLAAENWDMPVIVTTSVQFFESLFASRPSRCRKLHHLAESVVIFDEAQTIPVPYLQPCLHAIAELTVNYGASCVLCTATQPALTPLFANIAPQLTPQEIAPRVDRAVFQRVTYVHIGPLTDEELAARLNARTQALCIVGTRKQAQAVYALLETAGSFHLSTLMTPSHRRAVLDEIRERLQAGLPCRVVATSVIEAGVDVDFPVVYRAEAGLDSEIQAAGRCNREGKRAAAESMVYLFEPERRYTTHLPHALRLPMEVCRQTVRSAPALDAPETIARYFTALYQFTGAGLDQQNIVPRLEAGAVSCSYPFSSVAEDFRIIDSGTRTVLIPRPGHAAELARKLRSGERSRALLRQAGQEAVNIYPDHFKDLLKCGALEALDTSGDGIAVLTDLSLYDKKTGLALTTDDGVGIFL